MEKKLNIIYLIDDSLKKNRSDINTLFCDRLRDLNIQTLILDCPKGGRNESQKNKHKYMLKNVFFLLKHCNRKKSIFYPNIIQVRNLLFYALPALVIAKVYGIKFCYWLSFPIVEATTVWLDRNKSNVSLIDVLKKRIKRKVGAILLYKVLLRASDHIFVQSKIMKQNVMRHGISGNSITSVPMGVDEILVNKVYHRWKNNPRAHKSKIILYVGALDREREIELILKAFKRVLNGNSGAILRIIGDAVNYKDVQYLMDFCKFLDIENNVEFIGGVDRETVFEHIIQSDIGISSIPPIDIYKCSSPTKILEYLSLGLPTVANNIADQEMLINETKGGIVVNFSDEEFANAILETINNNEFKHNLQSFGRTKLINMRGYNHISEKVAETYYRI